MYPSSPALIKSPSLKTGDPRSPSIHLNLALAASNFLIIYMKYLIGHGIAEPGLTYAPGDSVKLKSATRMHEIFQEKFDFSDPLVSAFFFSKSLCLGAKGPFHLISGM